MSKIKTPSLLVPSEATFVKSALRVAGKDTCISPYLPHAVFAWLVSYLPEFLLLRQTHRKWDIISFCLLL
jgi:hypothetical protein